MSRMERGMGTSAFFSTESGGGTALSDRQVVRLLGQGMGTPSRPVAALLTRLSEADGAAWLEETARRLPGSGEATSVAALDERIGRAVGAEGWEARKEACKALAPRGGGGWDTDEGLAATLGYFVCVGACALWCGRLLSSRGAAEVAPVLLDLGSAVDGPWSTWFGRAALRVQELGS